MFLRRNSWSCRGRIVLQVEMCLGCSELDRNRTQLRVDPILVVGGRLFDIIMDNWKENAPFVSHRCTAYYMVQERGSKLAATFMPQSRRPRRIPPFHSPCLGRVPLSCGKCGHDISHPEAMINGHPPSSCQGYPLSPSFAQVVPDFEVAIVR